MADIIAPRYTDQARRIGYARAAVKLTLITLGSIEKCRSLSSAQAMAADAKRELQRVLREIEEPVS